MLRLEDRLDAASYCTMCGERRWVGLIYDEWYAVCSNCRHDEAVR